jgi:hypothetical protein
MASVTKPAGVAIYPESIRVEILAGTPVFKTMNGLGSDQVMYEWDWTSGTWKSFQQ